MRGYINGIDWINIDPMKYWSFSASYDKEKKRAETETLVRSGDYLGALKVDGYYQRLIKDEDGDCFMIARNRNVKGEIVNKIEWLPQISEWLEKMPVGTCLLCECYIPDNEGSKNTTTVLGCLKDEAIKRQSENNVWLHLYVFDVMAYNGINFVNRTYQERTQFITDIATSLKNQYVEYAEFFEGDQLWNKIQEYLSEGREGMVVMRKDAVVYTKRTPARVSIKIKREIQQTVDCVVCGANPPEMYYTGTHLEEWKYFCDKNFVRLPEGHHEGEDVIPVTRSFYKDMAGSLRLALYNNGEAQYFGDLSGLSDEILSNWGDYVGMVCEVGGMEIDAESGHIRHPKFIRWRDDKLPQECNMSQVLDRMENV